MRVPEVSNNRTDAVDSVVWRTVRYVLVGSSRNSMVFLPFMLVGDVEDGDDAGALDVAVPDHLLGGSG
jgi:hypothetical protein